jgi:NDP-sugar pyrophosphorylase family protein
MRAVILAGGKGTRLRPFTTSFPKPLMPVGDLPILEILLRQLRSHGVTDVTLLTGHLAYLIEGYFTDGTALGLRVDYVREEAPLGTAGPLRQLAGKFDDDFFVMNGDLLTDLDFSELMRRHRGGGAPVTVCTYARTEKIELGVLHINDAGDVVGYEEKPTMQLDVSMGVYAMSPAVLDRIPARYYDMPHLILDLLAAGGRVGGHRHEGLWLDIGRPDDYGRAHQLLAENPSALLPDLPPPSPPARA